MQKVYYYIGSNNVTHELETEKIEGIISKYFEGFTAFEVIGYWKGSKERTLKVEIITSEDHAKLARIGRELKTALDQDSIILEVVQSNAAFIQ